MSFSSPRLKPTLSRHRHKILVIDPNSGRVLRAFHARGNTSRHEPSAKERGYASGDEAEESWGGMAGAYFQVSFARVSDFFCDNIRSVLP